MPGWDPETVVSGTCWQTAAFVKQFLTAINERRKAVGLEVMKDYYGIDIEANIAADWIIQYGSTIYPEYMPPDSINWRHLQEAVEELTWYYIEDKDYTGESSIQDYMAGYLWTLMDQPSWTRYTVDPAKGGTASYGLMEANDIFGPWIFNDLMRALNFLVVTKWAPDAVMDGYYTGGPWGDVSYAAAEAGVASVWHSEPSGGFWIWTLKWTDGSEYDAAAYHAAAFFRIQDVPTFCYHAVDWYAKAEAVEGEGVDSDFDDQGCDVLENLWSRWLVDATINNDATQLSSVSLGCPATTIPTYGPDPAVGTQGWFGFELSGLTAIVRWNVACGFQYY